MIAAAAVFVTALLVYSVTVQHGLDYANNGELAAVAWTLGIAHPTGYPTITLLGYVFSHALPLRPIAALNGLAALLIAASAASLVWLFDEVFGLTSAPPAGDEAKIRTRGLGDATRATLAGCAGLATACSGLWWERAQHFDGYPLFALLLVLVIWLFLRFAERGLGGPLFACVLGLGITTHLALILVVPACLALWVQRRGFTSSSLRSLLRLAPWLALGLTPYLYLPLRSLQGPRFDWDAPRTWSGFSQLLSARDYGGWLHADAGTFAQQWRFFLARLPGDLGYIGLPLAILGVVGLARAPRLLLFTGTLFATSVLFAGVYGSPDVGPLFLPAALAIGIAVAVGLGWTARRFGAGAGVIAGAGWVAIVLAVQLPSHHLPRGSAVEDFALDLFDPMPEGALVLSHQWDVWLSGSFYLQEVEGLRRDIVVVNGELLGRPWYLGELERRAPVLCARIQPEIERMIAVSKARREGEPERDATYSALWRALVSRSLQDRPVYVTRDEISLLGPGARAVPQGLAFRVMADSADVPQEFPQWRFQPDRAARDPYGAQTCELYARSALDRAYYEASRGRDDAAGYYLVLARSFDPGWRVEDLPAQPWGAGATLQRSLAFFDALAGLDAPTLVRAARTTTLPGSPTP